MNDSGFPFREILLKPVSKPTVAQIEFFHRSWGSRTGNYLGSRKMLARGGFTAFIGLHSREQFEKLLRELDKLALPYEVKIAPIDKNGVVLRPFDSPSNPSDSDKPPTFSNTPRHAVIDLSTVTTRDEFVETMNSHFPCGRNSDEIWDAIYRGVMACPFRIQFRGWARFSKRMPRYARRLRGFLDSWPPIRPHVLNVEYLD